MPVGALTAYTWAMGALLNLRCAGEGGGEGGSGDGGREGGGQQRHAQRSTPVHSRSHQPLRCCAEALPPRAVRRRRSAVVFLALMWLALHELGKRPYYEYRVQARMGVRGAGAAGLCGAA